jgi:hypothetical protein
MNKALQAALASYGRAAIVAIGVAISTGKTQPKELLAAAAIAVIAPAIRAMNPKDAAFGMVADEATVEINKLVKADAKKSAKG